MKFTMAAGFSVGRNVIALAQMRGYKVVVLVRCDASEAVLSQSLVGVPVINTELERWSDAVVAACVPAPSVVIIPVEEDDAQVRGGNG